MRIYLQQFESGNDKYYTNVPISVPEKENSNHFKKLYVYFRDTKDENGNVIKTCTPTTGNITVTDMRLGGYHRTEEKQLKDKITGADVTVDIRQTEISLTIKGYEKTERDLELDKADKEQGREYVKPPYNAEQIAKNKLNAYNKRKSQQEDKVEYNYDNDFIAIPTDDLEEMLPF